MEALVVFAIITILATIGFPLLNATLYRTKVRTEVKNIADVMQAARLEAIRRGVPAVVQILPLSSEVRAFVDVNGTGITDPPDGVFNPVVGQPARSTDYLIRQFPLTSGLTFTDPDGNTGLDSVDGLDNPATLPDDLAIFQSDGSVASAGAFRLADLRLNYLEIRISPAATARVQIRKYDESLDPNWDGSHWYAEGEVANAWNWQ